MSRGRPPSGRRGPRCKTLADRISKEEALDLVEELPPELAPAMFTDGPAEGFDVDEFIRRVAEREGADMASAKCHAAMVFPCGRGFA